MTDQGLLISVSTVLSFRKLKRAITVFPKKSLIQNCKLFMFLLQHNSPLEGHD